MRSGWLAPLAALGLGSAMVPATRAARRHARAAASPAVSLFETGPSAAPGFPQRASLAFTTAPLGAGTGVIRVDDRRRLQPVYGVGAALTNSAADLIEHGLSARTRAALIASLFAPTQAGLVFIRISIGGSDFNAGGRRYSEDDLPPGLTDPGLRHFSLRNDRNTIAVLQLALKHDPHLRILASPWSAPAWMKTNHSLTDAQYNGTLLRRYYPSYARYFVKFIQGYLRAGVPIWGLTVQNEPLKVPATYEGMRFAARDEAVFIRDYLAPALRRAHLQTHIFGLDGSWTGAVYARAESRLAPGLAGVAWHCYGGNPDTVMSSFATTVQILSECATSLIRVPVSSLAANMFNDGASAVTLWSMAEDPSGGPVVPPNQSCHGCRGLVVIDPRTGAVTYNEEYYALAQFGRFLRPGARRISATRLGRFSTTAGGDHASPGLHDVAFRNPDGTDVLVVYNNDSALRRFAVVWHGRNLVALLPPSWTATLTWHGG